MASEVPMGISPYPKHDIGSIHIVSPVLQLSFPVLLNRNWVVSFFNSEDGEFIWTAHIEMGHLQAPTDNLDVVVDTQTP